MIMYSCFLKRFIDFVVVFGVLAIIWPILLSIAIWLHFANKGAGAFFIQERPGKHGKIFKVIKFKTMTDERDEDNNLLPDVKRLTKIGKFIRSTSIDELPQLINVLKGDMSLIGPRPERPQFVEKFREEIPRYMVKHQVRPGMTGWAQVNGGYDLRPEEKIVYDMEYIERQSVLLDVQCLLKTAALVFTHRGAR